MWYCTDELAFRQGLFFSAASVAGAFSGLLAYAISKMDGVGGYAGWRWIFILEGLVTVLAAVGAFFALYDFPDTASFLTVEEKAWVVHRLKYQGSKKSGRAIAESDHFEWKYVTRGTSSSTALKSRSGKLADAEQPHSPDRLATLCQPLHVLGHCMSTVWYLLFPSHNHRRSGIHVNNRPASHDPNIHNGSHPRRCSLLAVRPSCETRGSSLGLRLYAHVRHSGRLCDDNCCFCHWRCARCGVCRYLHRRLWYLSRFPTECHVDREQSGWEL